MKIRDKFESGNLDLFCGGFPWWFATTTDDGKHVDVTLSYPDGSLFCCETLTFKTWGKAHAFLNTVNAVKEGEPTPIRDSYREIFRRK